MIFFPVEWCLTLMGRGQDFQSSLFQLFLLLLSLFSFWYSHYIYILHLLPLFHSPWISSWVSFSLSSLCFSVLGDVIVISSGSKILSSAMSSLPTNPPKAFFISVSVSVLSISFWLFSWISISPLLLFTCSCVLSHIQLFAAPWTVACQAPLSMGLPRQEYWSGFPSPGDLPDPGIKHTSPAFQAGSLPLSHQGSPHLFLHAVYLICQSS